MGGISAQTTYGVTGFLVHRSKELPSGGATFSVILGQRNGWGKGREHVRRNLLIVRHLRDYLLLMVTVLYGNPEGR